MITGPPPVGNVLSRSQARARIDLRHVADDLRKLEVPTISHEWCRECAMLPSMAEVGRRSVD
jgi:hypothetical protein